jgi:hypothetical protein
MNTRNIYVHKHTHILLQFNIAQEVKGTNTKNKSIGMLNLTCACETWVLKETIKKKVMIFESKVLKRFLVLQKKEMEHGESKQTIN